jgi:receptor protein-tyrosine kinase
MSDDRKSLNLIQRAIDRKLGLERRAAASVEQSAAAQVPLRAAPAPADGPKQSSPSSALSSGADLPFVRLNMAALRRSGMINPEVKTSTISNEFRNIKRKVLLAARDKNSRELLRNLVMVTSTLPGEGKTFTSVNLALSLAAERDLQVLLVDCDLHRPSVEKFFDVSKPVGLAELLTKPSARAQDIISRCEGVPNLQVMFAGKHRDDSPELIASTRMRDILVEISEKYRDRIVVIDTPPALTAFEPAILASHVHQAIMVVGANQASRHQIEKALDAISGCNNITLLFNKAPKWEQRDGGYYYNYDARPEPA